MKSSRRWLDPQTREMLQPEPPHKVAPPTLPDYSLVLLEAGEGRKRMVRAVRRVNGCSASAAGRLLARRLPLVIHRDLSYHDAAFGQFEFVCCDAVTVIIASEVVVDGDPSYLKDLYARLRRSDEFQIVSLQIESVPSNDEGTRFLNQFVGLTETEALLQGFPLERRVLFKKARIMTHWARRIGAEVGLTADPRRK